MTRFGIRGLVAATALASCMFAGVARGKSVGELAQRAVSSDLEKAEEAIDQLRAMGPGGLEAMFAAHHAIIEQATAGTLTDAPDGRWQRVRKAMDEVAGQRNSYASRLYWYTDLESAKQAAADTDRPILSLRLLGRLTDEYSCANSRYFRTVLYANHEVADMLREKFVLHWQSERPVPRVTIDFGDGRELKRTLTGNSIHYVLDKQGRTVDALPGLYGPRAFLRYLAPAEEAARRVSPHDASRRQPLIREYHAWRQLVMAQQWQQDLDTLGVNLDRPGDRTAEVPDTTAVDNGAQRPVPARQAALVAVTKSAVEAPILEQLDMTRLASAMDDEAWTQLATLHADDARLDEGSIALIRRQNRRMSQSSQRQKGADPTARLIDNFQRAVALDTVRNEYMLHREIHQRFVDDPASVDMEALNRWVYAELFLTPASDPWLGLAPNDVYTALENSTATK